MSSLCVRVRMLEYDANYEKDTIQGEDNCLIVSISSVWE